MRRSILPSAKISARKFFIENFYRIIMRTNIFIHSTCIKIKSTITFRTHIVHRSCGIKSRLIICTITSTITRAIEILLLTFIIDFHTTSTLLKTPQAVFKLLIRSDVRSIEACAMTFHVIAISYELTCIVDGFTGLKRIPLSAICRRQYNGSVCLWSKRTGEIFVSGRHLRIFITMCQIKQSC